MVERRSRRKKTAVSSDDDDENPPNEDTTNKDDAATQKPDTVKVKADRTSRSKSKAAIVTKKEPVTVSSRQTKNGVTAEPKKGNKTIFSFFNAATQRRQASSQDYASQHQSTQSAEQLDDIQDDISDVQDPIPLAKSSQTAPVSRKRKLQVDQEKIGDLTNNGPPTSSQKFRKVSTGGRVSAGTNANVQDTRPWVERFAPVDISELAVHKRKVADVRAVLDSALSARPRPRLIVLKGAAGTAKTTTVKLLAKEMGIAITEWKNPVGTEASSSACTSASSQFDEFVLRSGRYVGLELAQSDDAPRVTNPTVGKDDHIKQLMLVEEFPNTFTQSSPALQSFRNTIQQFLAVPNSLFSTPTPLVMIVSEALLSTTTASADSFTAHRLLGPQILNHPQTAQIEFNNIAPTILVKALDNIVVKEARKSARRTTPGPNVLKRLAETGDIRGAISALEFLCLCGDKEDIWSAKVAFTKPKTARAAAPLTKREQEVLKLVSNRESSLGIFHAVGRVVYNKRVDPATPVVQPPNHLPQFRKSKVPENDPEFLMNEIGTDTSTFIAALHENYALSCSSSSTEDAMDSLNGCIDALSDSDMLSFDRFGSGTRTYSASAQDNLRQDDMCFQTAIRGLLFWLPNPVDRIAGLPRSAKRGDEFRMFYPSSLKLWKQKEEVEGTLESVLLLMQSQSTSSKSASSKGEGVGAWQRHQGSTVGSSQSNADDEEETGTTLPVSTALMGANVKSDLLLDRLPYAAQILPRRDNIPRSLISGIDTLVRISSNNTVGMPLEQEADSDVIDENGGDAPEWTDRPDTDRARSKTGSAGQKKLEFESKGLNIPVEHAVERLVLSDDDIED